jgi:hypothetical protein
MNKLINILRINYRFIYKLFSIFFFILSIIYLLTILFTAILFKGIFILINSFSKEKNGKKIFILFNKFFFKN